MRVDDERPPTLPSNSACTAGVEHALPPMSRGCICVPTRTTEIYFCLKGTEKVECEQRARHPPVFVKRGRTLDQTKQACTQDRSAENRQPFHYLSIGPAHRSQVHVRLLDVTTATIGQ